MIETKMGEITLKGSKAELIADLSVAVRGIKETIMEGGKETEESVKQEIDEAVKICTSYVDASRKKPAER